MESCRSRWPRGTKLILSVFLVSLSVHIILLNLDYQDNRELNDKILDYSSVKYEPRRKLQQRKGHQEEQHRNNLEYQAVSVRFFRDRRPTRELPISHKGASRQLTAVNGNGVLLKPTTQNSTRKISQAPSRSDIKEFLLSRSGLHNRFEFRYMINEPYRCQDEEIVVDTFLMVLILSHPLYKIRRDAIRDTWGTISRQFGDPFPVRTLFVIGRDKEEYTDLQILHESKMYRDIIQLDIADTYSNLTLKTILGLKWVIDYCPAASFVLKSDDDTMVNMTGLLKILKTASRDRLLLGSVNVNAEVMRTGRWGLTYDQYPFHVFPPYLNGAAYVMSMDTVKTIIYGAKLTELLPLEDVHLTGVIPLLTGVNLTRNGAFAYWSTRVTSPCEMVKQKLITAHGVQPEMIYDIWKFTTRLKKCGDNG